MSLSPRSFFLYLSSDRSSIHRIGYTHTLTYNTKCIHTVLFIQYFASVLFLFSIPLYHNEFYPIFITNSTHRVLSDFSLSLSSLFSTFVSWITQRSFLVLHSFNRQKTLTHLLSYLNTSFIHVSLIWNDFAGVALLHLSLSSYLSPLLLWHREKISLMKSIFTSSLLQWYSIKATSFRTQITTGDYYFRFLHLLFLSPACGCMCYSWYSSMRHGSLRVIITPVKVQMWSLTSLTGVFTLYYYH